MRWHQQIAGLCLVLATASRACYSRILRSAAAIRALGDRSLSGSVAGEVAVHFVNQKYLSLACAVRLYRRLHHCRTNPAKGPNWQPYVSAKPLPTRDSLSQSVFMRMFGAAGVFFTLAM